MGISFRWIDWNEEHVGSHGVSIDEAEHVIASSRPPFPQQIGDEKWLVRGQAPTGRYLQVIFVYDPDGTIFVIHARSLEDHEKRQLRRRRR